MIQLFVTIGILYRNGEGKVKMRKTALALILSVSCIVSGWSAVPAMAEDTAGAVPQDGLTGYWDFEGQEPMANKAEDGGLTASSSGDAVSVGTSDEKEFGNVLRFGERQGTSSKMTIASALNSGADEFSISFWIKKSSSQSDSVKTIILQQSGKGRTLLYRRNGEYVTFISGADATMGSSTGADVWEHLVLVKTGNASSYKMTLYVNGEKKNDQNLTTGAVSEITDLIIGAHKNANEQGIAEFVGDIDELRLYNRAVTEDEVAALFAEHSSVLDGEEPVSEGGLTGYWNFDDGDSPKNGVTDSTLTGVLSGSAVGIRQSETEEMGGVLHFDTRGTSNSEMRIANALVSGNDFSVSLWVNNSSAQNTSASTVILQQSGDGRSLLFRNNGQYITYISGSNVTLGTSTGSDVWEHLVLVKSGASTPYTISLYINGEKAGEQTLNAGGVEAVTDLIIGAHKNASDTGQFVGDIDELRLYNSALTENEVEDLFSVHSSVVLEQLISEAQEIYDQNLLEEGEPEAVALKNAISQAREAVEASDAEAVKGAMSALKEAMDAYIEASLLLTIDTDNVSRTVDSSIYGINHRYAFNGYGSFDPETMQMKEEFAKLYQEAGFGSLRYPGGTISNLFNWKDTIGPKDERVAQIHGFYNNSGQHGIVPNFGLAEVATFVQEYDSELVYVYGLGRGDANDAADLVEYLNAEVGSNPNGGTAWAEVRAKNGHEEPYNVRYFEIGNEMNQGGTDGTTAQTYWIDDVPGGALEGYINGGTATFTKQYVVARDDWNVSASKSDGSKNQTFYLRYALLERDENADDYDSFTAVNPGSVKVYVNDEGWTETDDLGSANAGDKVFAVDYKTGAISFGDGEHGAIPASGSQIKADYSVDRDGFVAVSEAMRNTMAQINEYNTQNGLDEKEIHIYSGYESRDFITRMNNEGHNDLYDGLTIHPYSGTPSGGSSSEETRKTFYYDAMKKGDNKAESVKSYVDLMRQYDETKVPVISEYGIFRSTDTMVRSQTHALYIARAIMEYVRLGSPYIQKHCLVDWYSEGADSLGPTQQAVIQAVSVGGNTTDGTGEFRFFSTPSARVFEMMNSSFGDQIIDSSLNYEQQLDNGVNQYSVMTSKDDEGNVYIAIVNLNLEGENKIKIQVDDLDLTGKTMDIQQLSGDTFYAENTLDNPDNVDVERSTATIESARASVTLAPHSFTVIKITDALSQETPEEPEPTVDTEKLEAAINAYSALQQANYTAESWAEFQTTLEAARAAMSAQTQDEVDAALAALQAAADNLVPAEEPLPTIDTEKLKAAIDEYSSLQAANYTAESWAKFQTALEAARAAMSAQTQGEVDAALAALQAAKGSLVETEKSETGGNPGAQIPSGDPSGQNTDQGGQGSGTPRTGDSIPIAGWTALIISCGIIILCMKRKRAN